MKYEPYDDDELVNLVFKFARHHPVFDKHFAISLKRKLEKFGYLDQNQRLMLERFLDDWHVLEFLQEIKDESVKF